MDQLPNKEQVPRRASVLADLIRDSLVKEDLLNDEADDDERRAQEFYNILQGLNDSINNSPLRASFNQNFFPNKGVKIFDKDGNEIASDDTNEELKEVDEEGVENNAETDGVLIDRKTLTMTSEEAALYEEADIALASSNVDCNDDHNAADENIVVKKQPRGGSKPWQPTYLPRTLDDDVRDLCISPASLRVKFAPTNPKTKAANPAGRFPSGFAKHAVKEPKQAPPKYQRRRSIAMEEKAAEYSRRSSMETGSSESPSSVERRSSLHIPSLVPLCESSPSVHARSFDHSLTRQDHSETKQEFPTAVQHRSSSIDQPSPPRDVAVMRNSLHTDPSPSVNKERTPTSLPPTEPMAPDEYSTLSNSNSFPTKRIAPAENTTALNPISTGHGKPQLEVRRTNSAEILIIDGSSEFEHLMPRTSDIVLQIPEDDSNDIVSIATSRASKLSVQNDRRTVGSSRYRPVTPILSEVLPVASSERSLYYGPIARITHGQGEQKHMSRQRGKHLQRPTKFINSRQSRSGSLVSFVSNSSDLAFSSSHCSRSVRAAAFPFTKQNRSLLQPLRPFTR